jgi:hypothetical protein
MMVCGAAAAQIPLTQVEGSHLECPDAYIAACAEKLEHKLSAAHPGIVGRDADGSLSVRLLNGQWLTPENECTVCDFAMELLRDDRYLAILSFGEEDLFWKLLDRQTGKIYQMEGYPLFSPDGQSIASAEADEMNINALDIYSLGSSGPVKVFSGILPTESWLAMKVCWADNATLSYERREYGADSSKSGKPEIVAFRNGKWRIETGGPRCAGRS